MTPKPVEHIFETHTDCDKVGCMVCDGGLSICTTCGLIEGSLTTECPGTSSFGSYSDAVYKGHLDFRKGGWVGVVSPYSPASRY
jgi:hypothetical protein